MKCRLVQNVGGEWIVSEFDAEADRLRPALNPVGFF